MGGASGQLEGAEGGNDRLMTTEDSYLVILEYSAKKLCIFLASA